MNIIVAIDENRGIGFEGNLLVSIPEDLRFFKQKTTGNVVVMGRKTLESLPNKRPLPNRVNIVLSQNPTYEVDGAIVVHSIKECKDVLKNYPSEQIYIMGGASIYEAFMPEVDVMYVTKICHTFQADAYFPEFEQWVLVEKSEMKCHNGINYQFETYTPLRYSSVNFTPNFS